MKFYNKPTIKKAAILTIAILGNVSGISLAAERRSAPTNTPDFTINQRVHLNNLQDDITRVELKCALTCKSDHRWVGQNYWRENFFDEDFNTLARRKIAGFSQTINLPINNASINSNQSLKFSANIGLAKKEHVDGYVCAIGLYDTRGLIDLRYVSERRSRVSWDGEGDGPLPPGIQELPAIFHTFSRLNNLHNPNNFSDCEQ